jgi:aspartate aminotransferase-like enzyme
VTFLFTPGPVNVRPDVLAAQARPLVALQSQEFKDLVSRTSGQAQLLFKTTRPVYLSPGSGPVMMEAAVRNLVREKVLCCINGVFGQRWCEVATSNGKTAVRLEENDGEAILPEHLATALRENPCEAVVLMHVDASTGVVNPLEELAAAVHETSPETLLLVDASASLSGCALEMDVWGIDFVHAVSHCCLGLPPGLVLATASERAIKVAEMVPNRGWAFDLLQWERHRQKSSMPVTPPISLLFALEAQLVNILGEGLESRFARYSAQAALLSEWADRAGIKILASPERRAATLTCLVNRPGLVFADLDRFLVARGMQVAEGYGRLCERTFRIAHMGDTQMSDLEALLEALEKFFLA